MATIGDCLRENAEQSGTDITTISSHVPLVRFFHAHGYSRTEMIHVFSQLVEMHRRKLGYENDPKQRAKRLKEFAACEEALEELRGLPPDAPDAK